MVSLSELAPTFGLLAGVVAVACNVPYLRDTWRGSTVPHRGSWLIWSVLEVMAVGAQGADGARWSLLPLVVQAAGTCLVLALAVRRGQGGLSRVDLGLLGLAALGLAGWMAVDEPVIATACVVVADLLAALMMVPKAWREPHSETLSSPRSAARLLARATTDRFWSMPTTSPVGPTIPAAANATSPSPVPRSSTRIPGARPAIRRIASVAGARIPAWCSSRASSASS